MHLQTEETGEREMLQKFSSKMMRSILIYLSKLFLGVDTLFLSRLASVEAGCGGLLVAASLMPLLLPAWMLCSTTTITNRVCRGYGQEKKSFLIMWCVPPSSVFCHFSDLIWSTLQCSTIVSHNKKTTWVSHFQHEFFNSKKRPYKSKQIQTGERRRWWYNLQLHTLLN